MTEGILATLIPSRDPIELVAWYEEFAALYRSCELRTKRWFVENTRPDWTIFDVGAHIGYYSILFSQLTPLGHVFAFEPTTTFAMLEQNLAHNRCTNVTPMQIAIGVADGPTEETVFRLWRAGNGGERAIYDFSTIDSVVERLSINRLDCIKIDVDSFDFDVLMGAEQTLKRFDPWIVVELCHALGKRGHSVTEALEWLARRGYRAAHVTDRANFILRRSSCANADGHGIHLTFENRPLPPPWEKGEQIKDLFAEPVLYDHAKIAARDPLTIELLGPRWAYACSWARRADIQLRGPITIELRPEVSGGAVGFGCVNDDLTHYLVKEIPIAPSEEEQIIALHLQDASALGHLVLRSVDAAGRHSRVGIRDIACFAGRRAAPAPSRC